MRAPAFRPALGGLLLVVLLPLLAVGGCAGENRDGENGGPYRIAVSIAPLQWAADALAPAGTEVTLLLDPGVSPHGATLTASKARALAEADLVLLVGWNFEPAMERALATSSRTPRVLRMSDVLAARGIEPPALLDGALDGAGHDGDSPHAHGPEDPHAWLDPVAMTAWLEAVADAVGAPDAARDSLLAVATAVDAEYRAVLGGARQRAMVTHHDGFGWVARRYGLEVLAVLRPEGLVETRPSDLTRATTAIQERGLGALFVEPQFGDRAALRVRDLTGARLLPMDPLGGADWPATMRSNLEQLRAGLDALPPGREA